jgi:putative transposase
MGLEAIYRKPRTSQPNQRHKVYPYLLKDMAITRPNQVWATAGRRFHFKSPI